MRLPWVMEALSRLSREHRSRLRLLTVVALGMLLTVTAPRSQALAEPPTDSEGKRSADLVPKDGTWAEYSWRVNRDDGRSVFDGTMTMRWVGTELVGQQRCRWIENTFVLEEGGDEQRRVVFKVLAREDAIRANFSGTADELPPEERRPLKMWIKVDDDPPMSLATSGWPNADPQMAHLMQDVSGFLPPAPLRDEVPGSREDVESRTVAYHRGNAECDGYRTRSVDKSEFNGGQYELQMSRSVWVFDEAPLRFVECEISRKQFLNGQLEWKHDVTVSLRDFGADAKTELPDHN